PPGPVPGADRAALAAWLAGGIKIQAHLRLQTGPLTFLRNLRLFYPHLLGVVFLTIERESRCGNMAVRSSTVRGCAGGSIGYRTGRRADLPLRPVRRWRRDRLRGPRRADDTARLIPSDADDRYGRGAAGRRCRGKAFDDADGPGDCTDDRCHRGPTRQASTLRDWPPRLELANDVGW